VHGGATLTFADYALCLVAGRAADGGTNTVFAVTVSIAVEFLDAGRVGQPLEASGEPLQVTGRLAFARGSITQQGKTIALWSGVCRHIPRTKAMERKEAASSVAPVIAQSVPAGFELLSNASVYSRHIGPSYARKEADGASLVQPTLPHMCNSGGVLHGGYMMSFADSAVTRAAGLTTGMAPSTVAFAAEFLSAGTATTPIATRVEVPRHGKSLAFVRGLLEQDGRKLLSYSATIKLRARA
jgi:acyl-coenzyme A thioesterase PaaI-like protein